MVQYVLVFDPSDSGLKAEGDAEDSTEGTDHAINPIDGALLKLVSKWFKRPQDTWKDALEKVRGNRNPQIRFKLTPKSYYSS